MHIYCGRHWIIFALIGALLGCATKEDIRRESLSAPSPAPIAASPTDTSGAHSEPEVPARAPVLVEGTGHLVGGERSGAKLRGPRPSDAESYQLNFVDADIATVVSSVLGEVLNLPHVIDPRIKGTMTLQGTGPLRQDDILPSLEAALRVQDIALVNVDGVYNVVPAKDAPRRVTSFRVPGDASEKTGFTIQIVPLRFVSASEIEKVLKSFAPDGGILRVDDGRNLLLLAGTPQELATMQDVVSLFDVDWLEGMSFGLFPLSYVDAKTLADELGQVFSDQKTPIANVVKIVPLARLNSLMVVTSQAHYLKSVADWIKRLDVAATTPGRRIYVYDVQNGKAADLAKSLSRILSTGSGSADTDSSYAPPLSSGTTAPMAAATSTALAPSSDSTALNTGVLKIVPNDDSNSLLILASPNEYAVIEAALKRLDVVPMQVLIEASLAEVTLNDELRYGVQWSYVGNDGVVSFSQAATGAISQQFPGFSYLFTGRTDIRAVLNALELITNVKVISSPKLLVLNNHEAKLQIGDQVPIVVQSAVSTVGSNSPIVNSVEMRDTGVILSVTPRVNKGGLALLEISQEVSDVANTTSSNINSPTIQQRRLSSSVAVHDGETIALGGLIRENQTKGRDGIPFLRRLPVIGDLFGTTTNSKRRTELIVLITPHVIRSSVEAAGAMRELREKFGEIGANKDLWSSAESDASKPSPK